VFCKKEYFLNVRFQILTAVAMKITVFWYVMQFTLVDIYRRFGGTWCLHLSNGGMKRNTFFRNVGKYLADNTVVCLRKHIFVNVRTGGTYSYQCVLRGWIAKLHTANLWNCRKRLPTTNTYHDVCAKTEEYTYIMCAVHLTWTSVIKIGLCVSSDM
jgi:hypothetical protein